MPVHTHEYRTCTPTHYLHSNVEAGDVEGLKHDLGGILSVLGCVEGRLCEEEVVVLWLCPQVLEDALFPEPFHEVPVLHDTVSDRIHGGISRLVSFISYVEVCVEWRDGVKGWQGGEREGLPRSSTPLASLFWVLSPT